MVQCRITLRTACETLAASDPALARAYDAIGVPNWRTTAPDFQSIARTVTFQLLSTRAAASIWGRVQQWCGGSVSCNAILAGHEDDLRACGLSRPKIAHLKSIAGAISDGTLDLEALARMSDRDARTQLIAVNGIGPWTADVFLMSAFGRMDAFPEGDVGLMEAFRMLRDDNERLSAKAFMAHSENWRPYRAVAAHLLWGYINMTRGQAY